MMQGVMWSVSELNGYIKELMDCDPALASVFVRGELSNYKLYPSGHHYFTLKDETSALRCVLFRREAAGLRFRPQNGMRVVALGRVAVFPRDGAYQLYCTELSPDGVGDLHIAFEQLKSKLQAEGLFSEQHKKPLPLYPRRIALVTSPAGAAVRDMVRILGRRWPMAEVLVVPVRVQGSEAAGEIARAISYVNQNHLSDLIITGRGGGSMEDLWAFNEETVVRAVFASKIPVISAVGHEPDVTIADFVSDLRAATPSHAAELAVPDHAEVRARLAGLKTRMEQAIGRKLTAARRDVTRLSERRALTDPLRFVNEKRMALDRCSQRLASALRLRVTRESRRFETAVGKLDALSPLKVLTRGYAIARLSGGGVVARLEQCRPGEPFTLRVTDGEVPCQFREE